MKESDYELLVELVKEMRSAMKEYERTRIAGWNYQIQRLGKKIDDILNK